MSSKHFSEKLNKLRKIQQFEIGVVKRFFKLAPVIIARVTSFYLSGFLNNVTIQSTQCVQG